MRHTTIVMLEINFAQIVNQQLPVQREAQNHKMCSYPHNRPSQPGPFVQNRWGRNQNPPLTCSLHHSDSGV